MFAYLEGKITFSSPSEIYLDVNGTAYHLQITLQTFAKIQTLKQAKMYTHLQIREDAWVLYGFADEQERQTFRQLLNINGVGAATSRLILSALTPDELERAVSTEDAKTLERIKGIGAKSAQRIILELKGKLEKPKNTAGITLSPHNTITNDALNALVNLGIGKTMAEQAIAKVKNAHELTVEALIKQVLRLL
jgi:Holliday junction DNA helicase RuvA